MKTSPCRPEDELPIIPFLAAKVMRLTSRPGSKPAKEDRASSGGDAEVFHAFAAAGKKLAELHVGCEKQPEFPLHRRENPQSPLNWRVEKMRLSKDKSSLTYNDFLTLDGIPPETFEYRLGNRSALEWVIDQYQVSTDKRSGITNDPNRPDDPEYIVRLLGQVTTVSLETVKVVKGLPALGK
jgi:predicted helicase